MEMGIYIFKRNAMMGILKNKILVQIHVWKQFVEMEFGKLSIMRAQILRFLKTATMGTPTTVIPVHQSAKQLDVVMALSK